MQIVSMVQIIIVIETRGIIGKEMQQERHMQGQAPANIQLLMQQQ